MMIVIVLAGQWQREAHRSLLRGRKDDFPEQQLFARLDSVLGKPFARYQGQQCQQTEVNKVVAMYLGKVGILKSIVCVTVLLWRQ
jgi:hypothetical protein